MIFRCRPSTIIVVMKRQTEHVLVVNISMFQHRDKCVSYNSWHEIKHCKVWQGNMPDRCLVYYMPTSGCHFVSLDVHKVCWQICEQCLLCQTNVRYKPKKDTNLSGDGNMVFGSGRSPIPFLYTSAQLLVCSCVFLVRSRSLYCYVWTTKWTSGLKTKPCNRMKHPKNC